jgi:hypothetical protein
MTQMPKDNRYGLNDGTTFILDCDKEVDATAARKDKLSFLLTVNIEAMARDKRWNVDAVRALATCLVPTTKDGVRLGKAQLIDNLRAMQEAERAIRKSEYDAMFERHSKPINFQQDVEVFASMLADPAIEVETIANLILASLKTRFKTDTSLVKTGVVEFKRLAKLHDGVCRIDKERVEVALAKISELVRPINKEIKRRDIQSIAERAENCRKIRPSVMYDHAIKTLSNPEGHTWKEVSIAMAYATGRRCSEIHGTKTWFKVTGEYSVEFFGQLKTRGRGEVTAYEIPTTIPAELVVKGWVFLQTTDKIYDDPRIVNSRLTKPLNDDLPQHLKNLMSDAGAKTYKDLRCFYAQVMMKAKPKTMMEDKYISKVMGHSDWDLNTSNTYRAFYTDETFNPDTHEPIERDPELNPQEED